MTENPSAAFLAQAIRNHQATGNNTELYLALTTYETALDHGQTQDDLMTQARELAWPDAQPQQPAERVLVWLATWLRARR